jgi:hypothetical protein
MRVSRSLSRKGHVILLAALHHARRMLACFANTLIPPCRVRSQMKPLLFSFAAIAVLVAGIAATPVAASSLPAILNPGQTVSLPDFPAGANVLATQTESFSSALGPVGILTEYVVNNTQFSPYAPGDLTFAFGLEVTGDDVAEVSLPGFAGFDTAVKTCDVAACIEGSGIVPDSAERSTDGDIVSFLWSTSFMGGSSGFSVYTNATSYTDPPMIEIIDIAGNMSSAPTFLPAATPLPTTWLMLVSGLVGLGFFAYRGTKKNASVSAA